MRKQRYSTISVAVGACTTRQNVEGHVFCLLEVLFLFTCHSFNDAFKPQLVVSYLIALSTPQNFSLLNIDNDNN